MHLVFMMLLMMLMSNFALTLRSEKILWVFTVPECDAIIADVEYFKELYEDPMKYRELIDDSEKMLEENGIPGIQGVDTRRLTRVIRDEGSQKVMICNADMPYNKALNMLLENADGDIGINLWRLE